LAEIFLSLRVFNNKSGKCNGAKQFHESSEVLVRWCFTAAAELDGVLPYHQAFD
jgi:hypothetical protein